MTARRSSAPEPREQALAAAFTRFEPPTRPPVFDTADVAYSATDTAVGRLWLARLQDGPVVACLFGVTEDEDALTRRLAGHFGPRVLRLARPLDGVRRELDEYLAGRRRAFEVPVDTALATPFQRLVLGALGERVGYGRRATYGELAGWIDRPRAARAVGAALGANPLCVLVPCHRVVGSGGSLTGYAGGIEAKRLLLQLESNPPVDGGGPRG
jgi:methylated-DNA-[protein]-cysteine S-methyltransferase